MNQNAIRTILRMSVYPTLFLFGGCWIAILSPPRFTQGLEEWLGAHLGSAGALPLSLIVAGYAILAPTLQSSRGGIFLRTIWTLAISSVVGLLLNTFSADPYANLKFPGSMWLNSVSQFKYFSREETQSHVSKVDALKRAATQQDALKLLGSPLMKTREFAWYPIIDMNGKGWNYRLQFDTEGKITSQGLQAYD